MIPLPSLSPKAIASIGLGLLVAALLGVIWYQGNRIDDLKAKNDDLAGWQSQIIEATSLASGGGGRLSKNMVATQISALGLAVGDLRNAVAVQSAQSEARAADLTRQRLAAQAERAGFDRERAATASSIDRLRALAQRPASGQCRADPALLRELEGL